MPITVVPRGTNTNPWETLAAGVAGNVISDLLGQIRQNDQNRKINAFKSQVAQDIDNYIRGAGEGIALSPQNLPQGYNSNPWASKQHETYSPLTQFDLSTAPQTLTTPAIPAANVPQDISRIINNRAGTKRFSMLNPDIVTGVRDDAVKMAEARRILGLQEKFANDYADAGSWDDRVNVLTNAGLQGLPVADQMKNFIAYAMHRQPHLTLHDTDTGESIVQSVFNPGTGQVTQAGRFTKTASPDEILRANTSLGVAKTNADASRDVANIYAGGTRYKADAESNIKLIEGLQKRLTDIDTAYNAAYQEIISSYDTPQKVQQALENSDTLKRLAAEKTALQGQLYELYSRLGTGSYGGGSQNNEPINHSFSGAINNGGEYGDLINKYAEEYNIDPDLLYAVIQVESGHKNGLTSDKGAQGLMQIIPSTAKYLGIKNVFDPDENIRGGTRYLRELLNKYNGDVEKALRAYNAGPGTVDAGRNPNPSYSRNVLAIYQKRKQAREKQNSQIQPAATPSASQQTQGDSGQSKASTGQQTTDRPLYRNAEGEVITQSDLDNLIEEVAKEGYGPVEAHRRLVAKNFSRVPEQGDVPQTPKALDWRPSYMTQKTGQVLTQPNQINQEQITPLDSSPTEDSVSNYIRNIIARLGNYTHENWEEKTSRKNGSNSQRGYNPTSAYQRSTYPKDYWPSPEYSITDSFIESIAPYLDWINNKVSNPSDEWIESAFSKKGSNSENKHLRNIYPMNYPSYMKSYFYENGVPVLRQGLVSDPFLFPPEGYFRTR